MHTIDLETHRHSMAHILAQAILRLYPNARLGIGPVVENGFYYEVESETKITEDDFHRIEDEMFSIVNAQYPFTQLYVSKEDAFNLLLHQGQIYKTEILEEIQSDQVSIYKTGEEFMDLCSGPHVSHTGVAGFFKLTKIEEGNWRNIPSRPKMQKIYGVGFASKKDLLNYLEEKERLKEIDHRKLGQKLGFYKINDSTGLGLPLWLPKGASLRKTILNYLVQEKEKAEYTEVYSPSIIPSNPSLLNIIPEDLMSTSFPEIKESSNNKFMLRVDQTPHHYQIFKAKTRSYRDLPFRIFEHGYVFRNELDNELYGLSKSKVFTAETNHIFCSEDQLFYELLATFQLATKILNKFGFSDYKIQLSTDSSNTDKRFQWCNQVLIKVIDTLKLVSRQVEDKSTQNGPKIEIFVKDLFDKEWQISSIQLDIFSTIKQSIKFIDKDGQSKEVIVVRSTFIGSTERIIGLLLEQTEGNLPLWMTPQQVRILPISRKYNIYAESIRDQLLSTGLKVGIDKNDETLQLRIKIAQEEKIPYMIIVGSKEESSRSISVRPREGQDLGLMKIEEFMEIIEKDLR